MFATLRARSVFRSILIDLESFQGLNPNQKNDYLEFLNKRISVLNGYIDVLATLTVSLSMNFLLGNYFYLFIFSLTER
jgi:hypothetical protein